MIIEETTKTLKSEVFHYLCELELKKAQRYQYFISVLLIELDHPAQEGGPAADERVELGALGGILRDEVRGSDMIGRVGEDRFSILLPFTDSSNSRSVGERIRSRIENHSFSAGQSPQRTVSIGIACYPTHAIDSLALLNQADETLLRARNVGGNRVFCAP